MNNASRELLPEDIVSKMAVVDSFVGEFVEGDGTRSSFQDGALGVLENWEQKREDFRTWSSGKESQLLERAELIKTQKDKLSESQKKMENLSVHEIDIRKSLNEETQKRKELEVKQEEIDKQIAELEARKEQISAEFEESKTQTGELDNQLGEVMETKEKCTTDIE